MSVERWFSRLFRLVVVGLLCSCPVVEARAEDLMDVYLMARQMDPALLDAQQGYLAALARVDGAQAALLPNASINSSRGSTYGKYTFDGDESARRSRNWNWKLQVTQGIIRVPEAKALEQSDVKARQAFARLEQVEQELALRVTKAYLDVELAIRSAELIGVQLGAYLEQLRQAEQGLVQGTHSRVDLLESRSRVEGARAQQIAALNEVRVKRTELARVIGKVPETLQRVREDVTSGMPATAGLEFWTARARDISPQVRERRAAVLAAELEVKKVKAEHLPRLDLVGSTGSMANSENTATPLNYSSRSQSSEVMLQLIVPIFSGGGISARTRESQAEVVQAQAQLESVLREVDSLTEQAFLGIASGLAEVQALEAAREAARSALSANQTSFRLGARTLVDVLNAQQQLFTVERDLLKARHGLLVNHVKFTLATQDFDIETMRTINLWFDPALPG